MYLNQEFDSKVLYLVKQKGFHSIEYMSGFENFKEKLPSKEKFSSLLACKKISATEYEHVLKVSDRFEMKMMEDYHGSYLKCDIFC